MKRYRSLKLQRMVKRFKRVAGKLNRNYTRTTTRVGQVQPGVKIPKSSVDIQHLARIRQANKFQREELSADLRRLGRRKRRRDANRRRRALRGGRSPYIYQARKLTTDGSEYVIATGDDYKGYYHIHDNENICTEAIHIKYRSQTLIAKEEYLENKIVYERLANNLGLEHKKLWKTRTQHFAKKRQLRRQKIGRTLKPTRTGGY